MSTKTIQWACIGIALLALAVVLAGCIEPQGYSDWRWRQWNPESKALPGDPDY